MGIENKIKLYLGDITELKVDAIVNAANNHLYMGGGVAGAIKRKGGKIIEDEAVSKGPVPVGEAVATNAGKLKAKYVIHAAGMGLDFKTDETKIRDAAKNSLKRADELKIKSVAFPSIGTGVGGFPPEKAAEIMINTVKEHLSKKTSLETVVFALYSKEVYEAFEEVLG
ncbi:MAG: macro domain-containing protein [Thermoplasmatales archaeon]|nr:macro domain-containing protein [Thermoplasmatales archaeon]